MTAWALVTPASRGIGLEIARRLLRTTSLPVIATARRDLDETRKQILAGHGEDVDKGRLEVVHLDVCDESTIAAAADRCRALFPLSAGKLSTTHPAPTSSHLHLAFLLPGILHPEKSPAQLDTDHMLHTFRVNTIGPLLLVKHFSPFLPKKHTPVVTPSFDRLPAHATVAALSARVGSITDNTLGGWYSYRSSKAALNQVIKTFDNHLRTASGDKAIAVGLHPGTVKTGLSKEFWRNVKEGKLFTPEFAAESLCNVVYGMGLEGRGRCWDWAGKEIPP